MWRKKLWGALAKSPMGQCAGAFSASQRVVLVHTNPSPGRGWWLLDSEPKFNISAWHKGKSETRQSRKNAQRWRVQGFVRLTNAEADWRALWIAIVRRRGLAWGTRMNFNYLERF